MTATVATSTTPSSLNTLWPTPPYASYVDPGQPELTCEVEGTNGQVRSCMLTGIYPAERLAYVKVPPSQANMPLRFSMFRRITVKEPLVPMTSPGAAGTPLSQLADYRTRIQYRLLLTDGSTLEGQTIGHVELGQGLFLFLPLDAQDSVERVFIPREMYRELHLGEAIGQVLVQQHAVSSEQVELAAREQENLRNRKLGDYLVIKEIVKPEQLLVALEQQSRMPMVRIGEALTALGLVSEAQLLEALEKQKSERTVPLGELLVKSGQLSRQDLRTALARKMGYPAVDVAKFPIDIEALRKVPLALAKRLKVVPLMRNHGTLVVAAEDPSLRALIEELEFTLQCKVVAALASGSLDPKDVSALYAAHGLDSSYKPGGNGSKQPDYTASSSDQLLETLEQNSSSDDESADDGPLIEQSDNSLVRLINTLIVEAYTQKASDIHIETFHTKRKVRIRLRKDGRLVPYMELPHTYRAALVARIKIMCDLDISERRKPQDGKIDFTKYSPQHKLELRVATIPTHNGAEDVVMRLLASAKPVPLEQLSLAPHNLERLKEAVQRPYGMVLCVGPTGSGKTTTLHSALQLLNTPDRKIWTAEDPIEITNPDLRQVQVNPKIDWTFAKALRSFLRADPDIIMVGEIRDQETAQVAIEASLTGHLVLSTLHTNSAPETVVRLLDMGMDPFNFADSLLAVLAQRLVRRLCTHCKTSSPASDDWVNELLADYLHSFPNELRPDADLLRQQWLDLYGDNGQLLHHHAPGCPQCNQVGLKDRLGLHELMTVDGDMRRLIQNKAPAADLLRAAMGSGQFRTLRQDGIAKVLQGLTTIDEVRASCNI
ncbi:MAG TPA: ATPase, T2SS/T4P/T4SS family [Macromonas sp.]|nr:ATPase, T2SS/T4P/T4SS family [Macromonas sp.]